MTEDTPEKTPVEKMQGVISRLKEMEHYSRSNIEKLSADWFLVDDELKEKESAPKLEALLITQNKFQEQVVAAIEELEDGCGRLAQAKP